MKHTPGRGYLILSYAVVCGKCNNEMMTGGHSAESAWEEVRENFGWRYTKAHGWICSSCVGEEQP